MEEQPKDLSPSTSKRSALVRALLFVAALAIAFAVFRWTPIAELIDGEKLAALLEQVRETAWAAPLLVVLFIIVAPLGVPISPLVLAGGAVFGLTIGWMLNLLGALLGGAATFLIGQHMGRDLVIHLVGPRRLKKVEKILEQHGFWAIVRIRFLPIPYAMVNYGAALAGVRFGTFFVATAIGLAPSLVIYTTLSHALVTAAAEDRTSVALIGGLVIVGALLVTFIPTLVRVVKARKKET